VTAADFSLERLPPLARDKLDTFARRLLERNASLNLTGARDAAAVAEHVRDSLAVAPFARDPHVDVGSGGGFPAIPLAVATGVRISMIESLAKKAAFLREIVGELALDAEVVAARAEDAGRDETLRGHFASATARAVGSVPVVLELTLPLLAIGGTAVLQRGSFDDVERRATADALLVLGGEIAAEIVDATGADRRVLLVRKTTLTNQRFPRRAGIPAKRPLCADG
jgi:16S rRNA (guanine527-N7)-methyltransferase